MSEIGVLHPDIGSISESEWLSLRKQGIGGSDCAKVLGVSPWGTKKDLFWDKTTPNVNVPPQKEENWIAKEVGHRLESLVIEIFAWKNPDWKPFVDRRMFYCPAYPWMIADCDAFVRDPRNGRLYALEVKTTSAYALPKWGARYSNTVPVEYEAQVRHYMAVLNKEYGAPVHVDGTIVICLAGNNEDGYRQRFVLRNAQKEKELISKEADFWNNYVKKDVEPPFDSQENIDLVLKALDRHYGKKREVKEIPPSYEKVLLYLAQINGDISKNNRETAKMKKEKDVCMGYLLDYLKGCEGKFQTGDTVFRIVPSTKHYTQVPSGDMQSFMTQYPEAYSRFVKEKDVTSWQLKSEAVS